MNRFPLLTAAAIALCGLAPSSATATDLLPPLPSFEKPLFGGLGSGWYLRGDAGYSFASRPDARAIGAPARGDLRRARLDPAWSLSAGLGYRYNSILRAEIAIEHRFAARFAGADSTTAFVGDIRSGRGDLSSVAGFLNGYLDLGTWYGVTPYVGAGIGIAHHRLGAYRTADCAVPCPGGPTPGAVIPGRSRNSFAYSAMAGISVALRPDLALDVGYRYADLGRAETRIAPAPAGGIRIKRVAAHEVRAGLRWTFDLFGR